MCSQTAFLRYHTEEAQSVSIPCTTAGLQSIPTNISLQEEVLLLCHVMMSYTNKMESDYCHNFVLHSHSPWKQRNIANSPLCCDWHTLDCRAVERLFCFGFIFKIPPWLRHFTSKVMSHCNSSQKRSFYVHKTVHPK